MVKDVAKKFFAKYPEHPYALDNVTIKFEYEGENELNTFITTPRLEMESTKWLHKDFYRQLTSNQKTMGLYGTGEPWSPGNADKRVGKWVELWQNDIPFSSFIVSLDDKLIGHIALDYDDSTPAQCAELSYIFDNQCWGDGYASESAWAVVNPYADEILTQHDSHEPYLCQGKPYQGIYATARPDNPSSVMVLFKSGLDVKQKDGIPIQTQWGDRLTFFKKVADSPKNISTENLLPNAALLAGYKK